MGYGGVISDGEGHNVPDPNGAGKGTTALFIVAFIVVVVVVAGLFAMGAESSPPSQQLTATNPNTPQGAVPCMGVVIFPWGLFGGTGGGLYLYLHQKKLNKA